MVVAADFAPATVCILSCYLLSLSDNVLPLILCTLCTFLTLKIEKFPAIRKRITQNFLWKVQFFCHPVWMFSFLYFGQGSQAATLGLIPFAFNFLVEPWDIPNNDLIFRTSFFMHHIGPILGSMVISSTSSEYFILAQALLFMHGWLLHTISFADNYKWISKQRVFWPYCIQGFLFMSFWWWSVGAENVHCPQVFPTLLFWLGRWGVFLSLQNLFPDFKNPKSTCYDAFEDWKQIVELGSFCIPFLLLLLFSSAKR
uniref:Uncharacterized protein n=1 Tax=Aplanochytrium stocchinoi TaxID=215587 RepID=A0A7S3PS71_9STRA|mmetsp:Transcript_10644/g.12159  ORF Transcript_10644/g.12159 Transcript_10644/m.12159 type:complete len:256 (+) Transcript_10644:70-837(+)